MALSVSALHASFSRSCAREFPTCMKERGSPTATWSQRICFWILTYNLRLLILAWVSGRTTQHADRNALLGPAGTRPLNSLRASATRMRKQTFFRWVWSYLWWWLARCPTKPWLAKKTRSILLCARRTLSPFGTTFKKNIRSQKLLALRWIHFWLKLRNWCSSYW